MKYLYLILLSLVLMSAYSQDTTKRYPIKLRINDIDLNCFKSSQTDNIYKTYLLFENCEKNMVFRDSTIRSLQREVESQSFIIENDKVLLDKLDTKVKLYTDIIKEKDVQLKLKDREKLVDNLRQKKTNYTLEIFVFIAGGLIGYAIAK